MHSPWARWKEVISTPQASGGLACRDCSTGGEEGEVQSFPSSSMASISRHCMPSACDSWMEWACLAPWDSAFLIAIEQQPSASAMVEVQLALASLIQVACCQASASLMRVAQWASAPLMVEVQRAFASLMALVVSDSFWHGGPSQSPKLVSSDEHWERI